MTPGRRDPARDREPDHVDPQGGVSFERTAALELLVSHEQQSQLIITARNARKQLNAYRSIDRVGADSGQA
jgi:hypothetical protein